MTKILPHVTIAILNYNGKEFLERNLPFLYQLSYSNFTITVIDNASTDNSVQWLKDYHPAVNVIFNKNNFGYAKGYNEGLKQIRSDYYLLLNTDVEVTNGFLEPMVDLLEKDPKNAICQPKILSLENKDRFEYAGAAGGFIDNLGYPFARGRLFFTCEEDNQQYNASSEIFWASGACLLIKADCFWEVKGFYDYYFMQHEELDLCWRLKIKGYKVLYIGETAVYHQGGAHLPYKSANKNYLNYRNNWIMLYRNLPPLYFWFYIAPLRVTLDIIASFYFLNKSNFITFLSVYKAILHFGKWLIFHREKDGATIMPQRLSGYYNNWIVFDYFIRGRRTYSKLYK